MAIAVNWREILGWTPDQMEELRLAGFSFLREGKWDKAILFFKALVILDTKNSYDLQTLGALYLQKNEGEVALSYLNQALSIDPKHEPTQLNKVKTLIALGRKIEAIALARELEKSADLTISGDASALVMAYT